MLKRKDTPRREPKQIGPGYTLRPRAVAVAVAGPARASVAVPKQQPVRSEPYLRAVASLPCCMCRRPAPNQAAHANTGKGMAQKTDDRTAIPLCADRPSAKGCHSYLDQGGMPRAERRALENMHGQITRRTIKRMGLWPPDLAVWPGDE